MFFTKIRSILVSERVFERVNEMLYQYLESGKKIGGYYCVFNNCREQGYVLRVYSTDFKNPAPRKDDLLIWVYEHRNSDNIVVVNDTKSVGPNDMFTEAAWRVGKHFERDAEAEAADYIIDLIDTYFLLGQ